ncbi:MAG: exo-alpha-sialidase [bacterium]|nr:exo-alpha-sialidase [bacterium]
MALCVLVGSASMIGVVVPDVSGAMEWSASMVLNTNAETDLDSDYRPELATDGQGNWVCVWHAAVPGAQDRDFDIMVARSSDDGATWSAPAILDAAGADPLEIEDDFSPVVYTDGDGHWIAAWYTYDSRGGTLGDDTDILVSRSTDNGATWTTSAPLNSDATTDHLTYNYCSDTSPRLAYDGNGHWVATFYLRRTNIEDEYDYDIYVSRSSDHGASWSDMQLLHASLSTDSGEDTIPQIAADTAGSWVITYKSTNLVGTNGVDDEDLHFSRSTDNGVTWSAPTALNTDASTDGLRDGYSGGLDILTDGTMWVTVWVRELPPLVDYDLMISRSYDAGITWSPPENLNPDYAVDGGFKDLDPRLGTDGAGNWVVVWDGYYVAYFPWGLDHDPVFMRSDDGTQTWSQPAPVNTHAYIDLSWRDEDPVVVASPHGQWLTVWFSTYNLGGTIGNERDILYATSCVPVIDGDQDCDGDVDLYDFFVFQDCFTTTGPVASQCGNLDFDDDDNVDLDDYAVFQGSLNGPGE